MTKPTNETADSLRDLMFTTDGRALLQEIQDRAAAHKAAEAKPVYVMTRWRAEGVYDALPDAEPSQYRFTRNDGAERGLRWAVELEGEFHPLFETHTLHDAVDWLERKLNKPASEDPNPSMYRTSAQLAAAKPVDTRIQFNEQPEARQATKRDLVDIANALGLANIHERAFSVPDIRAAIRMRLLHLAEAGKL